MQSAHNIYAVLTADAIKYFGSRANLARALGISRAAVSYWGEQVPALRAYQIREIMERDEDAAGQEKAEQTA